MPQRWTHRNEPEQQILRPRHRDGPNGRQRDRHSRPRKRNLDPVGARIWQLLGTGHSVSGICDVMVEEYEVSREALEHDVLVLAQELVARKLIGV